MICLHRRGPRRKLLPLHLATLPWMKLLPRAMYSFSNLSPNIPWWAIHRLRETNRFVSKKRASLQETKGHAQRAGACPSIQIEFDRLMPIERSG
jgi:hypothetical protein